MIEKTSTLEVEEQLQGIIAEHGRYLRHVITRHCPTDSGIQISDIEQDAHLRIWRALQGEREIRDLASYLHKIAATATIDAIRRVKARREEQLLMAEDEDELYAQPLPTNPADSPENHARRQETNRKIATALSRLPEDRRRAVGLDLQGYTTQEIADLLGWTEPKARNLVYRGRQNLREQLRAEGIDCETD
ncbi:MAG: RNA polymerase sigma factor [Acidobacteriota bacterium]